MADLVLGYVWAIGWLLVAFAATAFATTIIGVIVKAMFVAAVEAVRSIKDDLWNNPSVQKEYIVETVPRTSNVIDLETMSALAHVKNHPSMRFVEKG